MEAVPAILAWNRIDPVLLRAIARASRPPTTRRLAWLADVALAVDRRGGFPGGCRRDQLGRFIGRVPVPPPGSNAWDGLGRPTAAAPRSPIWKRWRISYDADLDRFEQRARSLDELRRQSDAPGDGRRGRIAPGSRASDGEDDRDGE